MIFNDRFFIYLALFLQIFIVFERLRLLVVVLLL